MRETAPPIIAPTTRGFSLIELSVVVLIIGILIYMTLAAGREQLEIARIKQTQYKLQKIQTALAVYLKTFGYLPCPADGTAAINSATFGAQSRNSANSMADSVLTDSSCSANLVDFVPVVYIGVVPVTTLGMSPESMFDGWGNRITYIVSIPCIDPDNWVSSSRFKCVDTSGGNQIDGDYITLSGTNGQSWPANAAYMTISYGLHCSG
jgi:prepilin-type N-terminal cleavage/methylation domain-containing protein